MAAAAHHRVLLLACAGAMYAAVTVAWIVFEAPGLGIGHFYYVPIALTALATDTFFGVGAGLLGTALYIVAIYFTSRLPTRDVATAASAIRLVTFCGIGALIGWFASATSNRSSGGDQAWVRRLSRSTTPTTRRFSTMGTASSE